MRSVLPLHGKGFLMSLILLGALAAWLSRPSEPVQPLIADIAVEHQGKLVVQMTLTTKSGAGLLDIAMRGGSGIYLSVPQNWTQTEVRNVTLADVSGEDAAFGFTRLKIPSGAGLSYKLPTAPDKLRVHNPGGQPMDLRVRAINLDTKTVKDQSALFTDEQAVLP